MTLPSRQTTCGECWHYGPIDATEGYCGRVLPEAKPFPATDDEGKPSSLTVTVRPIVRADDPGCYEFRPLGGDPEMSDRRRELMKRAPGRERLEAIMKKFPPSEWLDEWLAEDWPQSAPAPQAVPAADAASWKCRTYMCGGIATEPGGYCEGCLGEEDEGAEDEGESDS